MGGAADTGIQQNAFSRDEGDVSDGGDVGQTLHHIHRFITSDPAGPLCGEKVDRLGDCDRADVLGFETELLDASD
jgi:hypothetical protein